MLRNSWPTSRSSSPNSPAWRPLTYAVETCTRRRSDPPAAISRASSSTRATPSTLISRACSSGSSNEIDAAQWMIRSTEPTSRSRSRADRPSPGCQQVAAHRPHPRRRGGRLVVEARQHAVQALARAVVVARADEHHDLLVLALDQARERVHSEEARRSRQQDRAAHDASVGRGSPTRGASEAEEIAAGEGQPIAW